ncbi:MAG TPA: glycoside hydrolase family 172 protein, partial [Bacilli bacterium]
MSDFNGLQMGLGNLSKLSKAKTRSISAENFTGEKGKAGMATEGTGKGCSEDLGQGWKVSPSILVKANSELTLAEINDSGVIQHIWCTCLPAAWRSMIIKFYWDGEEEPSVNVPIGDFFCNGWGEPVNVNSLPIVVNPRGAFNSYWTMPFRKSAKITMENISNEDTVLFYQVDYTLTEVPEDEAYFHAQFRRVNPLPYKEVYTLIDGIKGQGHYVGTYMAWQVNSNRWWGEGEIKFYMDGDAEFPTICGTGTEDYFGGAWNWEHPIGQYGTYTTPYLGMHQVIKPDGLYQANQRFGMYRWHV